MNVLLCFSLFSCNFILVYLPVGLALHIITTTLVCKDRILIDFTDFMHKTSIQFGCSTIMPTFINSLNVFYADLISLIPILCGLSMIIYGVVQLYCWSIFLVFCGTETFQHAYIIISNLSTFICVIFPDFNSISWFGDVVIWWMVNPNINDISIVFLKPSNNVHILYRFIILDLFSRAN